MAAAHSIHTGYVFYLVQTARIPTLYGRWSCPEGDTVWKIVLS